MDRDPVCNQEVDERSPYSSTYQSKIYYFNSPECKADFDKNPGRYAGETMEQAGPEMRGERVASRARTKIESMISGRKNKAAEKIRAVSDAFRTVSQRLKDQNQETMARYADRAADNVERLSGYLQENDAERILYEAEDFVRRRPALMIGSALAAGFIAARFLKSSKSVST